MNITTKQLAFEYLLTQMLKWGKETIPVVPNYTFTRLKALKMLFFASVVKNEQGEDLLDVFNNFYALPNGPVESDIYNLITADQLTYYSFKEFSITVKNDYKDVGLEDNLKQRIDSSISILRQKNKMLLTYNAEQLVNLSHSWKSWQDSIQIARALGKGSYRMDVNKIRTNTQIFAL